MQYSPGCALLRRSWGCLHRCKIACSREVYNMRRKTNWCSASLTKMSSSGCCIPTRVHNKMGNLRPDFRPVQNTKVQLPLRNLEGTFVQAVFWDHSVWQKCLVLKLSNYEIFLMSRCLYAMPWRLGEVSDKDCDHESFPRRKPCQENSEGNGRQKCWRKAEGPHNTVKPQTTRCDKEGWWDSNTPTLLLFLAAGAVPLGERFTITS